MEKLLISACLLGTPCRYDGGGAAIPQAAVLAERYQLVPVCPELLGGLPCPRTPAEWVGNRVLMRTGEDVTAAFLLGARRTLEIARAGGVRLALLKERSPSCGLGTVYDGTFTGTLTAGDGAAAAMLRDSGVTVYGETRAAELLDIGGEAI